MNHFQKTLGIAGIMLLAHDGKPLYLYSGDQKPGDRNDDNFKGDWHLAKD